MKSSSEFSVIRKYFSDLYSGKGTVLGPGDDCAVLRLSAEKDLATSCDTLVEGIHFPVGSLGSDIAYRAIATSASDLAAIGAKPLASVISLSVPSLDEGWLKYFRKGLSSAIRPFLCHLLAVI